MSARQFGGSLPNHAFGSGQGGAGLREESQGTPVIEPGENNIDIERFHKTRPDDFIRELSHINGALETDTPSPIDLVYGLETMMVTAAAHMSAANARAVTIDYDAGFIPDALKLITP